MAKWLVTHTADGEVVQNEVVEADTYDKAYLAVLYKMPHHYSVGTICSGIISVEPLTDQNNDKNRPIDCV